MSVKAKLKAIEFAKKRKSLSLAREDYETWQKICTRTAKKLKILRRKYGKVVWHGNKVSVTCDLSCTRFGVVH